MSQKIIRQGFEEMICGQKNCLTVLFPGFGYGCDRPLLRAAYEKAVSAGHDVIQLQYGRLYYKNMPLKEAVAKSFPIALKSSLKALEEPFSKEYKAVYFVSKSFGTMVAGEITRQWESKNIKNFYLTPIEESFCYLAERPSLAAAGTNDPLIAGNFIKKLQDTGMTELFVYQRADHSLEVKEDKKQSIWILEDIRKKYDIFFHIGAGV